MSGHSTQKYFKVYFALVILFLISYIVPEMMPDNKVMVLLSAFGIAIVKALMVCAYFMHLNTERKFVWYLLISCLTMMYLFYIALVPDIMRKEGHNWKSHIEVVMPENHHGHDDHHGDKHENTEHHEEKN